MPHRSFDAISHRPGGTNHDRSQQSFDDNERTDWSNDGQDATAWIKYEFARPAVVGEVTMKLSGWRTQSYPIRILVDEKVVFSGDAPRSLGYITFAFPPQTGRSLRIELTGSASNKDAFGNIIEIPGTPDPLSEILRRECSGRLLALRARGGRERPRSQ